MAGRRGRPPKPKPEEQPQPDPNDIQDGTGDLVSDEEISEEVIRLTPEEVKNLVSQRESMAKAITTDIDQLSGRMKQLLELEQKIYMNLSQPDSLFSDCVISPAFTKEWCRQQLYAFGLKFGEDIWEGEISVLPFYERIKQGTPWILRFIGDLPKKKTGIEAIVE